MRQFLEQLRVSGEVSVPPNERPFDLETPIESEIRRFDAAARRSLAGEAPALDLAAAEWAARKLAEAAQAAITRNMEPEAIARRLSQPGPKRRSPEADYSADLFLRYLPDLADWLQRLAPHDPLLEELRRLGASWPLSSVGIKELPIGPIEPFIGHPALRQLYVDRILARSDVGRLGDLRVDDAVRAALGAHPNLNPAVAERLGVGG